MRIQKTKQTLGALAAVFLAHVGVARAADAIVYGAMPKGSKITVAGDSTMHAWKIETTLVGGKMTLSPDFPLDGKSTEIKTVPEVDVRIPVRNLKSGKEKMDNVTMQAMNQDKHKYITYKLKNISAMAGKPMMYNTSGDLTVNGITKSIYMPVKIEPLNGGANVKVTGEANLKMSDFKVVPPKLAILGVGLVVKDDVKLDLLWMTKKR